jgi:hydrophobic/amphiphilic exporter-1 (mainly G- bacteria), HAE1 family
MHLSEMSIKRPVTTLMAFVAMLILGYISFSKLRVNFLPEIQTPRLTIQTKYKDATPSEVMRLITEPVEQTLGTLSGVKKSGPYREKAYRWCRQIFIGVQR